VIVADHQTGGKGRAGRSWLDVPGRMLMFSALLRDIPPESVPLVSLASGLTVARSLGPEARLKWPNDVQIEERKVSGVIGELAPSGDYVVVGIGVNVAHEPGELPDELLATSIRISSRTTPRRDDLCIEILKELDAILATDDWLPEYRSRSATLGARVRVELSGQTIEGEATEIRSDGALVVDGNVIVAGDVVHVR
jgi:BirA family biotin operon repressor/biotin-[acetyl-CoA-carboxylase] ligase